MLVVFIVVLVCGVLPLMFLTGLGGQRRGMAMLPAMAAGVLFPATWVVWYVRDEHPYRRVGR